MFVVGAKQREYGGSRNFSIRFPLLCPYTLLWAQLDSNQRPIGYAYHFGFRRPFRVRGLDYPFIPARAGMPAV